MLANSSTVSIIFPPDLATTFIAVLLWDIDALLENIPSCEATCLLTGRCEAGTKASAVNDDDDDDDDG